MNRISIENRKKAINLLECGSSQRQVAIDLDCSRRAVQKIQLKWLSHNTVENLVKCGRPLKTTERERRVLKSMSTKNPFLTARELKSKWIPTKNVSVSTIKRILNKYNIFGRISARKPLLTKRHMKNRLLWCSNYKKWSFSNWSDVIYSDECMVDIYSKRHKVVWRPAGKRFNNKYTQKTVSHSHKSIMLFGAIKADGSRILVQCPKKFNSDEYTKMLSSHLLPFYNIENIYMQDNAPIHRSKVTMQFIEENGIIIIDDWPAQSPDLNIIENLWAILKYELQKLNFNSEESLWKSCVEIWNSIPPKKITQLYQSIPNRLLNIIRVKGANTKY